MIASIWNHRLIRAVENSRLVHNVLVAFNSNIDAKEYINSQKIHVAFLKNPNLIDKVRDRIKTIPDEIRSPSDFFAGLYLCMKTGKSLQWIIREKNKEMLQWFEEYFDFPDEERMGGQSGIIANLMSILDVESYIYCPLMSPKQTQVFREERIFFPVNKNGMLEFIPIKEAGRPKDDVKINWVFEYRKGTEFPVDIEGQKVITNRANRFIVASRPKGLLPLFDLETEKILPEIGASVDRVIVSGYQYIQDINDTNEYHEDILDRCVKQLLLLRSKNNSLKIHMEFAGIRNEKIRKAILLKLSPQINSLGLNESEILNVLEILDCQEEKKAIEKNENAFTLYEGMAKIRDLLGFERLHLHNLGYHLLILHECYPTSAAAARNALLFASNIGAAKALTGDFYSRRPLFYEIGMGKQIPLSYTGFKQLELMADHLLETKYKFNKSKFMDEGILECYDRHYYLIISPAQIVSYPRSTVGLGDSISSAAFIADQAKDPHGDLRHCVSPELYKDI
ncbi:MAG: ADP-dependent glucokinase/phosphofructokinase [Candidatus Helarchaeota archaeon]